MKKESGVSLIESLLVVVVIGSIVFLIANIPNALMLIGKSRHLSLAREIAVKQIEDKRAMNYANLVIDNSLINDTRLSLLPGGSGTVEVSDCDPSVCTNEELNEELIKQVKATVSWMDNGKSQNLTIETMIGEGGINQ